MYLKRCVRFIINTLQFVIIKTGKYDTGVELWGYNKGDAFYQITIGDALPIPFPPQYLGVNLSEYIENQKR